ncbi:hypothetical protein EXIGLDRAFT_568755, partial [Exidia glandulosa HHB12029]
FPCAPKRPSLAFSMRILEFIALHSLNVAPNVTAWAATFQGYWDRRGYVVRETTAFRKRLANALHWYEVLLNEKEAAVEQSLTVVIEEPAATHDTAENDDAASDTVRRRVDRSTPSSPHGADKAEDDDNNASRQDRPSEYLRRRCPICFGGLRPSLKLSW